jgi:hypothetical protein
MSWSALYKMEREVFGEARSETAKAYADRVQQMRDALCSRCRRRWRDCAPFGISGALCPGAAGESDATPSEAYRRLSRRCAGYAGQFRKRFGSGDLTKTGEGRYVYAVTISTAPEAALIPLRARFQTLLEIMARTHCRAAGE